MTALQGINGSPSRIKTADFNMTCNREHGEIGFRSAIRNLASQAIEAVRKGVSILIITDRNATIRDLPIPGLLMLRSLVNALNDSGDRKSTRLNSSHVAT